jgi:hypothetical protein
MRRIPATAPETATSPAALAPPTLLPVPASVKPSPNPAAVIMDDPTTAGVLYSAWSGDPAIVVPSPPGAGKTRLVALLAVSLATRADLRIGIAAQTRDQAVEIARRIGALGHPARLIWPVKQPDPDLISPATLAQGQAVRYPDSGGGVLIATTARWIYADPAVLACDLMIVDEAWQAAYADLGALGAFAPQIVCVGDPGQISPVITGQISRWATSPTGPHLPAPKALIAAHGEAVSVITLRHTWRLGPATTRLIQPRFYPDMPFTSRRPPEHLTTASGDPLPEVTSRAVTASSGPGDPNLTGTCADVARALMQTTLTTATGTRPTTAADIAVIAAHVSQAAAIRALLSDHPDVLVGTANQLQGMERPAAVALHPLAGYRDPTTFGTDLGRACVMLSRHRAHLTVVTDAATPAVLNTPDPAPDVATHRALLTALLDAC